ncbi:MAG TPA: lipase family protein [Solirubrobacterales bacterium]|nr:lipase family protein [Solirubrobacterales bacterium]
MSDDIRRDLTIGLLAALLATVLALALAASAQAAPPTPEEDPFYDYAGSTPLAEISPGTVLKSRTLSYHVAGIPLPVKVVQLLYRSTSELGEPTVNVTSVLKPPIGLGTSQVVAYQSFYDSLNPADEPSYAISGGLTLGGAIPQVESALIGPELLAGRTVVVADTEGEDADFAAGPEYGINTLDSLRAALAAPATGLAGTKKIGLVGYSGGAIATEWAAELAPSYAPGVNAKLVGAAMGGVLVDPAHNLHYIEGSFSWAGVMPMAIIGVSRAFHIDLTPYLSEYGKQLYAKLEKASISEALAHYPGLTWAELAKPEYAEPEDIPIYVHTVNQLIMGENHTPTTPLFIGQGALGELEGTPGDKPGIGEGDGVMIAGDVRSLAREYCARGDKVLYDQYPLGHITAAVPWLATAVPWLEARFAGASAPKNCASIEPGNSLTPIAE